MNGRCIMMCAGDYRPMKIEKNAEDFVIAVDGGLAYLEQYGPEPDFLMGDFDSLDPAYMDTVETYRKMGGGHFLELPVVKDDTDTLAAAKIGLQKGYRDFRIYGGMGNRLDHVMANIQTLVWILKNGGQGWLLDRETSVTVVGEGLFRIPDDFEGTVSLFALDEKLEGVTIRGMKYEAEDAEVGNDYPIGCSNETLPGKKGSIRIGGGTALIVMTENLINRHH